MVDHGIMHHGLPCRMIGLDVACASGLATTAAAAAEDASRAALVTTAAMWTALAEYKHMQRHSLARDDMCTCDQQHQPYQLYQPHYGHNIACVPPCLAWKRSSFSRAAIRSSTVWPGALVVGVVSSITYPFGSRKRVSIPASRSQRSFPFSNISCSLPIGTSSARCRSKSRCAAKSNGSDGSTRLVESLGGPDEWTARSSHSGVPSRLPPQWARRFAQRRSHQGYTNFRLVRHALWNHCAARRRCYFEHWLEKAAHVPLYYVHLGSHPWLNCGCNLCFHSNAEYSRAD